MADKRRTQAEIVAQLDQAINYHKECIAKLETKKKKYTTPKITVKDVFAAMRERGMTIEDTLALIEKKKKA